MHYQTIESTRFYDATNFEKILQRLESIQPASERKWGSMNSAQMLHHLNISIGSGLGYYDLEDVSTPITRTVNKFLVLSVLNRFPISTKTARTLKVTGDYDFEIEKKQLKQILKKAFNTETDSEWNPHTYFGKLSRIEWGKLILIHCHHHFQQFSV